MTTDIRLTDADLERIERHQAAPRYDVLGTTAHCAECGDDWPCDVAIARRVTTADLTRLRAVAAALDAVAEAWAWRRDRLVAVNTENDLVCALERLRAALDGERGE